MSVAPKLELETPDRGFKVNIGSLVGPDDTAELKDTEAFKSTPMSILKAASGSILEELTNAPDKAAPDEKSTLMLPSNLSISSLDTLVASTGPPKDFISWSSSASSGSEVIVLVAPPVVEVSTCPLLVDRIGEKPNTS
ncbi:hypothetical protein GGI02_000139 [Coemansia sp. RSA 2322]|nr:hypothetical protein GGI02_000139 [Coemansia sp. RSA 2322]